MIRISGKYFSAQLLSDKLYESQDQLSAAVGTRHKDLDGLDVVDGIQPSEEVEKDVQQLLQFLFDRSPDFTECDYSWNDI